MKPNVPIICKASREDVPKIVQMLADDFLGQQRERFTDPLPQSYYTAFDEMDTDKNNWLMVVKDHQQVIGVFQLTFIPGLSYQGGKRALVEGVRVHQSYRGKGIGKMMLEWAIAKAREHGCHMIQLTSNKKRNDAIEFYKKLGFVASHEGLKLDL